MSLADPGGPYRRPSLQPWITSLRVVSDSYDWVRPTFDEENIAVLLGTVEIEHRSDAEEPDNDGWLSPWGQCASCAQPWPCPEWMRADGLGRLWSGRAADRYAQRADAAWQRLLFKRRSVA